MFSFFFSVQKQLDVINSNLESLKSFIIKDMAELHVKFDKLIDILIKNQSNNNEKLDNNVLKNNFEKDMKNMKPLRAESDINNLEQNLRNQDYESAFINVISEIGGTAGNKNGTKISYLLIDRIFERKLLTLCSWTENFKNLFYRDLIYHSLLLL
ncbi:hypothetical protein PUN28_002218 [Cardiocondyla obscurior]|uniref:DUF4806 domain-containing protein n=1 Tax=Cardiocondyla obscurior TaxID=286306 RepID=A0AAW2GT46_9HYME